jgi:putative membrane protein
MMGWYQDATGWGGWIVVSLVMVAFWALVVFAVVAIFRATSSNAGPADRSTNRDPMQILEERFARGEIDAEEFHTRAHVLRSGARPVTR